MGRAAFLVLVALAVCLGVVGAHVVITLETPRLFVETKNWLAEARDRIGTNQCMDYLRHEPSALSRAERYRACADGRWEALYPNAARDSVLSLGVGLAVLAALAVTVVATWAGIKRIYRWCRRRLDPAYDPEPQWSGRPWSWGKYWDRWIAWKQRDVARHRAEEQGEGVGTAEPSTRDVTSR
jgi:hypothetical protein